MIATKLDSSDISQVHSTPLFSHANDEAQHASLPILVIVDVQEGFLNSSTNHLPERIHDYVSNARNLYSKIIATQFYNPEGSNFEKLLQWERLRSENETRLDERVALIADTVIAKNVYSATSAILEEADKVGTREVHFCGIDTDVCVLLNASGVFDAGYCPKVLHFLCASSAGRENHEATVKQLGRIIGSSQVVTDPSEALS